ncbi:SMI1/KNR4 family protein [Amycolatopsis minnesotensis]|uniref:Knr4/Smi1-like domain-containing protein n=1 Tax=Amycolatopsis minnesotensis TaxID=337894 RepID=A0ABN2S3I3_9PSEU
MDDRHGEGGVLGNEPGTERAVAAAEHRLAVRFPPSFRHFLLTSDGCPGIGAWTDELYSCDRLAWFRDTAAGETSIAVAEVFYGESDQHPDEGDWHPPAIFERSLLVAGGHDYWLLDPADPGAEGEWIAWRYEVDDGELTRFTNFAELVDFCRTEGTDDE